MALYAKLQKLHSKIAPVQLTKPLGYLLRVFNSPNLLPMKIPGLVWVLLTQALILNPKLQLLSK